MAPMISIEHSYVIPPSIETREHTDMIDAPLRLRYEDFAVFSLLGKLHRRSPHEISEGEMELDWNLIMQRHGTTIVNAVEILHVI